MNLIKLQERIASIIAENIATGAPERNTSIDIVCALSCETPKGRRRKTQYIPLDFVMQHPLSFSGDTKKRVYTISARQSAAFTA